MTVTAIIIRHGSKAIRKTTVMIADINNVPNRDQEIKSWLQSQGINPKRSLKLEMQML